MRINRETFIVTEVKPLSYREGTFEVGSIEATFAGKTIRVEANRFDDGTIYLKGFVGHYVTSSKAWRATVSFGKDASEKPYINFGRDDRSGRFNKANMIQFAPDAYAKA